MSDIAEAIKTVIAEQLGMGYGQIKANAKIKDDLGADSLDLVELVLKLEERYGIEIPDEDGQNLITVGQIIKYIGRKIT